MCGIIGINEKNENLIEEAAACFSYRGPDNSSTYFDESVSLRHHRLSIVDLDPRSSQPMSDISGRYWVVFNGEIYNYLEIKDKLKDKYSFRTSSDTEVLLYAYQEWGEVMCQYLQGMFAFAIYDKHAHKIFLARDHVGIKPLYYYCENGVFVFSSEIKGIVKSLKIKNINLEINQESLDLFLTLGYIPSPLTLYKGIKRLSKSSCLEFYLIGQRVTPEKKFTTTYKVVNDKDSFVALLEKKILDHLMADVPVGLFFSGGTDSSIIAAILHKHNIQLENFSIKTNYKTDDFKYFSEINGKLNIKSEIYDFDLGVFDGIYEEVMSKIDEPSYDNSIFPTYYVSKMAAKKVKVVLSGEGGDEFFYGYPRSLVLYNLNNVNDYRLSFLDLLFFFTPTFKAKNHIFQKLFVIFRKPLSYYLLHMSPSRDLATFKSWRIFKKLCFKNNIRPIELDQEFYLENDLLRKIDMATSYVSIEGRVPLLDFEVIKNSEYFNPHKLEGGVLKSFLKSILSIYLPNDLVYRSKSGFGLNMVYFFKESKHLSQEFDKALKFLRSRKIKIKTNSNLEKMKTRYPLYCFALISLYRSIKNNEEL